MLQNNCPGQAIITMDPVQPKIAMMSFYTRAAGEDSPPSFMGAPAQGITAVLFDHQRPTFARQQTERLLASFNSHKKNECPQGLEENLSFP